MPDSSVRIAAERRFPVPVEQAFDFITDVRNWPRYWPGYVRLEPGSRWQKPGDQARLVIRLLGRERELAMRLIEFEPHRVVRYASSQPGLPDAIHVREFAADGDGSIYRLAVAYRPRSGLAGAFDRTLLVRSIRGAFDKTLSALERELSPVADET